tara:strand:- start:11184 stop:11396 length:213 start_codon:yes stop_codon:yes gene_type:complete
MTYHFKNEREVSLEVTKMMWKSNLEHKASLKMIINFYKLLLSNGTVKVGGSANKRLKQLQSRLNDQSTKD